MKTSTRKLTLSALFLALGLVLPLITGQIPQIGKMLLPMHIPVLLCGMVCGWPYGLAQKSNTRSIERSGTGGIRPGKNQYRRQECRLYSLLGKCQ